MHTLNGPRWTITGATKVLEIFKNLSLHLNVQPYYCLYLIGFKLIAGEVADLVKQGVFNNGQMKKPGGLECHIVTM